MIRKVFFFVFLTFFLLTNANGIYFNHLGSKDGLSQINVMSIYQDETGAMWFGTAEGICRYNGKETETFSSLKNDAGLTQNNIYAICGDNKGSIYIKADFDLIRYDIKEEKFHLVKEGEVRTISYQNNVLWFATNTGIFRYDNHNITKFCSIGTSIGKVSALLVSENNDLWLGSDKGLTLVSQGSVISEKPILRDIGIYTLYKDTKGNIWIGSSNDGIYLLNKDGQIISHFEHKAERNSISNNQIRTILEDSSGKMWIGTFYGLNSFDPLTQHWESYVHVDNIPHSISHTSIFSLYEDTQGTVWVGTYFGGVNYFNSSINTFRLYTSNPLSKTHLSYPFVGKMTEDGSGNLWICTEGGGLNCLNLKTRQFSHFFHEGNKTGSGTTGYNLKSIWYREDKQQLYIGIHNGGLRIFDLKTKAYKEKIHNDLDKHSLPDNIIRDMQHYNNSLILLTATGISRLDLKDDKVYDFSTDSIIEKALKQSFIYSFYIDTQERMWLSVLEGIRCIDLRTKEVRDYRYNPADPSSLGKFRVTTILETSDHQLYFGTSGSGLFKYQPETNDFKNYIQNQNGLMSNFCYHLAESPSGNLIILSNAGVTIFDARKTEKVLFQSSSNFPLTSFFHGSSTYVSHSNEIFIGGVNGLVSIFESQLIDQKTKAYNLYFDKLFINNKQIRPNDETKILNQTLSESNEISLNHNQNNVMIKFASSNYLNTTIQDYEYKLVGFDENWNKTNSNTITYTNISAGDYKLLLKEISKDGSVGDSPSCEISIIVKPPFYKSSLAYVLYAIFFVLLLVAIIRFFLWRSKLSMALESERRERERNEILNQTKLRFFTNVSHELRTPLTLILGQLDIILQNETMNTELHNKISSVHRNAGHMRNLISELIDFRKQEQGFSKLRIRQVELIRYLHNIYDFFKEYALKHNIIYLYEHLDEDIIVYIDPDQMQKAVYNLLSNAFKYTSPGEKIIIRIVRQPDSVTIQIEDNGIGIPAESISKIFDRFYQVEYRASGFSLGSGIGLALAKEIVKSHHGDIHVRSTINEGSIFEIILQLGKAHFGADILDDFLSSTQENVSIDKNESLDMMLTEDTSSTHVDESKEDKSKNSILIVEDNEELRAMLAESFSERYTVYEAVNGKEGLDMVRELQPDIVLSDVMMPGMSGKEMCYKIKNNINISHIPVILLTAQDSVAQTIEGYMYGADAYITKPFNMDLLISHCNSLVVNRKLLYQSLAKQENPVVTFNVLSEHDQTLIDKATTIVKKNFDTPEFNMDILASELGIGRNKLYTRIKDITGLTPNEFALNIKLNEAQHLLVNSPHLNVSDISLQLGFSSAKYFSKCFRTFFGVSPMQWRRDEDKNKVD
ncbi:hybrid sensor histidine kinase/response regulator transcription factor [Dysgonomonas macrotermitis]|uniref:histidine kinase n=1 Tax=Dysgonomonas macrotermitis TaxID=1346286 RepID=A0A1M4YFJ9_9BACT|nr:two-component regulator propeller domain-containing protein [Dysgonomonas macrotermitis]SHF04433.1 Signal transduction histidine kinase [Dysgonomonas macrotermitis]